MASPNIDYKLLLKEKCGIELPHGAPAYQAEYLFYFFESHDKEKTIAEAKRLFERFPNWTMPLDDVLELAITRK